MASKPADWLSILSDFVRRHPRTSAAVAFNLGVIAAGATKKVRPGAMMEVPSKLTELVPSISSMQGLADYIPDLGRSKTAPKTRRRKTRRRKTANAKTR